jgi:wobble nucleotide-excising tRNase
MKITTQEKGEQMVITKLEKIKDYGIFTDYTRSQIKDFGVNNILFGWNYSGKTTLSRIFRSLEVKKKPRGFELGKFSIALSDGSIATNDNIDNNALLIRVFNADYVYENLKWEQLSTGLNPILIVGEENVILQSSIDKHNDNRSKLNTLETQAAKSKMEKEKQLSNLLTDKARQITNEFSLNRQFDKTKLEELLKNNEVLAWELSEIDYKKHIESSAFVNKLDKLDNVTMTPDVELFEKTQKLLKKIVSPSHTIEHLKKNPKIENWVREGRILHKEKELCGFCGGVLRKNFLSELDEHFSKDYEAFRKEVYDFSDYLKQYKLQITPFKQSEFYKDLQSAFYDSYEALKLEIIKYNEQIELLISEVIRKAIYLPIALSFEKVIKLDLQELENKLAALNDVIDRNNSKTEDFDRIKQNAIELLKKHSVSSFYSSIRYSERIKELDSLQIEIVSLRAQISKIDSEIQLIDLRISESTKGCESLNSFIKRYFGGDTTIEIKVINNRFHLFRGNKEATNLSEGEKTAISFSYFLTRLNDKDTKKQLKDTIVYIDDPISSLDNNHLYNTFSLIASQLKDNCGQLFISTHNFEFFNLLKDLFKPQKDNKCSYKNRHNDKCASNLYLVQNRPNGSVLDNVDCLLCHFKSEYQFLFYHLYQLYQETNSLDDLKLYAAPNLLRRFLETFTSFAFPSDNNLFLRLKKLIVQPEDHRFVFKIINELSHNENTERSLKLYTTEEIKEAIKKTFIAFENNQSAYFIELKSSAGISNNFANN